MTAGRGSRPGRSRLAPPLAVVEDLDYLLEGGPVDPVDERLGDQPDGPEANRVVAPLVVASGALRDRRIEVRLRHLQRLLKRCEDRLAAPTDLAAAAVDPRVAALDLALVLL